MKRQVYLHMKGIEEARELFFSRLGQDLKTGIETVRSEDALHRVTAQPVFAENSIPSFHASAMDGIAVKAERTFGTTERHPGRLKIGPEAVWINTGQRIPPGFDAVIMVEKLHQIDEEDIEIREPVHPWQNVRKVGEDIIATQLLFPRNHMLDAYDLGALVSGGVSSLKVRRKPLAAVIPTGSELVSHRDIEKKGAATKDRIVEYNSIVISGLIRQCHGIPHVFDIVPDHEKEIRESLAQAVESDADLVIINAGSSAGSRDFTPDIISEVGEVLVHGIAMMPGKPTILAIVKEKPVIGIPGYAVSSALSFEVFAKPLLYRLQGARPPSRAKISVKPTRDIPSKLGIEEFLRVNIGKVGPEYMATPLPRAAGSITTLTRADGLLRIPDPSEGITSNEKVDAELLVDEADLLNTVVVIGSHDICIDLLADQMRERGHIRIASSNVGSLGGLMALRKGNCHMAGSHLLDTGTGEYNISYVHKYLKGIPVSLFHLVMRDQGLIIPRGNPKDIRGFEDLLREDILFVNRQPGSGTRVLLDYQLEKLDLDARSVRGYGHEEFTHMAVAVDVLSGTADCGLGIRAAAVALGMDFIPVVQEQYDLIVPLSFINEKNIQAVLEVIQSRSFRDRVRALGGYDPSKSGELWMEMEL